MTRLQAIANQTIDDPRVLVTRFDFAPGAETGWHRHALDYVIIALTDLQMMLEEPGGEIREVSIPVGTAYRREAGVEHNVINNGSAKMSFIEVELK